MDTRAQRWHRPAVTGFRPVGRRSHSACKMFIFIFSIYTSNRLFAFPVTYKGRLFVFGGFNGIQHKHYNDLLRYDPGKDYHIQLFLEKVLYSF